MVMSFVNTAGRLCEHPRAFRAHHLSTRNMILSVIRIPMEKTRGSSPTAIVYLLTINTVTHDGYIIGTIAQTMCLRRLWEPVSDREGQNNTTVAPEGRQKKKWGLTQGIYSPPV